MQHAYNNEHIEDKMKCNVVVITLKLFKACQSCDK